MAIKSAIDDYFIVDIDNNNNNNNNNNSFNAIIPPIKKINYNEYFKISLKYKCIDLDIEAQNGSVLPPYIIDKNTSENNKNDNNSNLYLIYRNTLDIIFNMKK